MSIKGCIIWWLCIFAEWVQVVWNGEVPYSGCQAASQEASMARSRKAQQRTTGVEAQRMVEWRSWQAGRCTGALIAPLVYPRSLAAVFASPSHYRPIESLHSRSRDALGGPKRVVASSIPGWPGWPCISNRQETVGQTGKAGKKVRA